MGPAQNPEPLPTGVPKLGFGFRVHRFKHARRDLRCARACSLCPARVLSGVEVAHASPWRMGFRLRRLLLCWECVKQVRALLDGAQAGRSAE